MKRTSSLFQEYIAFTLVISLCLQSCGEGFNNNPLISTEEKQIALIQPIIPSTNIQPLVDQVLTAQGGHAITFYEEVGQLKADVEMSAPQGFSKTYKRVNVYVEKGADVTSLPRLDIKAQEYRIRFQLAQGEQPAKVIIYEGAGLAGGGKKRKQLTNEQKAKLEEEKARKREERVKKKEEKAKLMAEKVAFKNTPLHEAILEGNTSKFCDLVESGADIHLKGRYGNTPLQLAVRRSTIEIVKLLIDHGADINTKNEYSNSLLHIAVGEDRLEMVKTLLECEADVNDKNKYQNTPLHWAIRNGYIEVAKLLLEYGADVNAAGVNGASPLHVAIGENQIGLVKLLLEKGANINAKGKHNDSVLHWTAARGHVQITKLLLEYIAYINNKTHWDVFHNSTDVVKPLVKHKASINCKDNYGDTPLHKAARNGHLEVAEMLLAYGADVNAKNIKGLTSYKVAKKASRLLTILNIPLIPAWEVVDKKLSLENEEGKDKGEHEVKDDRKIEKKYKHRSILSEQGKEEEVATVIAHSLQFDEQLKCLDLSGWQLSDASWQEIVACIPEKARLKELDIRGNLLTEGVITNVPECFPNLKRLEGNAQREALVSKEEICTTMDSSTVQGATNKEELAAIKDDTREAIDYFNLVTKYEERERVEKYDRQAFEWCQKAANQGNDRAQYKLGTKYSKGKGVSKDYAKAKEWYQKAANQGNVRAQYNLGLMYCFGQGGVQDYIKAAEWFQQAAKQGYVSAQINLGIMYEQGHGLAQNYAKAEEYYEKAAGQGGVAAQTWLGYMSAEEKVIAKDEDKAVEWYQKAADQGHATAQDRLKNME
jgi:ankyrin repeat protein/TPR repeat protein